FYIFVKNPSLKLKFFYKDFIFCGVDRFLAKLTGGKYPPIEY
ncbi:MAG: hypothetical protein PWP22_538, partial [Thermoanaerobacter sp.]|nr:hypothetical protein [Thermoanaerobacter sp.]